VVVVVVEVLMGVLLWAPLFFVYLLQFFYGHLLNVLQPLFSPFFVLQLFYVLVRLSIFVLLLQLPSHLVCVFFHYQIVVVLLVVFLLP